MSVPEKLAKIFHGIPRIITEEKRMRAAETTATPTRNARHPNRAVPARPDTKYHAAITNKLLL